MLWLVLGFVALLVPSSTSPVVARLHTLLAVDVAADAGVVDVDDVLLFALFNLSWPPMMVIAVDHEADSELERTVSAAAALLAPPTEHLAVEPRVQSNVSDLFR